MTARGARRPTAAKELGRRLALALAMQREGLALMRENLRRAHPTASEDELAELYERWLLARPCDAPGRPISWPRRKAHRAA
jgi:hypothetical protein